MTRVLRVIGVAVLAAATLHATAGLCFCHRGSDSPVSLPGGHSCCHGPDASGALTFRAIPTCCHIETAQRDMTPTIAVQLAPPPVTVIPIGITAGERVVSASGAPAFAPSPPIQVLRL
jgi:hypothetical protein